MSEEELAAAEAEQARLQREIDETKRDLAAAYRVAEASASFLEQSYLGQVSFAQTILQAAAVVFGLTISFLTPNVHQLDVMRQVELGIALVALPASMLCALLAMIVYRLGWTRLAANRAGAPVGHPTPSNAPTQISMGCFFLGVGMLGLFSIQQLVR